MENQESQNCCAVKAGELEQCQERYRYLMADFENHRRREEKERAQRVTAVQAALLTDLLVVIDDFERAVQAVREGATDPGVALVYQGLLKYLERYGVTAVPNQEQFDPHIHEVLVQVPDPNRVPGTIIEVLQKGYLFKGQLLRPARVSVAAAVPTTTL